MPGATDVAALSKKRKRGEKDVERSTEHATTPNVPKDSEDPQARILLLENQILESRKHYNNIAVLIKMLKDTPTSGDTGIIAGIALCRVFCRLIAAGTMSISKSAPPNELTVVSWLRARYKEYTTELMTLLREQDGGLQTTALTLLMRLVKTDGALLNSSEHPLSKGLYGSIVGCLVSSEDAEDAREEFVEKYVREFDDIRYYAFVHVQSFVTTPDASATTTSNALSILSHITPPDVQSPSPSFFLPSPPVKKSKKHPLLSPMAHKTVAQSSWLALLNATASGRSLEMDASNHLHTILSILASGIVPWFHKPELLMDFCTDCYSLGGSTALLALSGLFHLMQERNLDYPDFFPKLYSLLDADLLHSRHRSRFFRLLDTFLSSTHLPATLVASFIKRLSRLALHAPPAGIVMVIPWIYNMLKKHPTCTFMIHRVSPKNSHEGGMLDPFDMAEADPIRTNAIESSLWEIETLQSHYHPNVGTLAKIISEQFTKHQYNIEDFFDHSYGTMLDAELTKEIKKTPVVEYDIPKRVFTKSVDGESDDVDSTLAKLWDFPSA